MLLLTEGARPKSVAFRGGIVYIGAHDVWYTERYREYIGRLRQTHPDTITRTTQNKHYNGGLYRSTQRAFRAFKREQRAWYSTYGVKPPRVAIGGSKFGRSLYKTKKTETSISRNVALPHGTKICQRWEQTAIIIDAFTL